MDIGLSRGEIVTAPLVLFPLYIPTFIFIYDGVEKVYNTLYPKYEKFRIFNQKRFDESDNGILVTQFEMGWRSNLRHVQTLYKEIDSPYYYLIGEIYRTGCGCIMATLDKYYCHNCSENIDHKHSLSKVDFFIRTIGFCGKYHDPYLGSELQFIYLKILDWEIQ